MPNLYIITGPAGVGKSTISNALAKQKNKSALIEGDDIYNQVIGSHVSPWKPGNHLQIFWKICINTIKVYLESGYDVIFNYIVTPENLELIKNNFKEYTIKFVVLLCNENILISRDAKRPIDCQMNERCIQLLNNFKNYNFNKENLLDTTNLAVSEIVTKIDTKNNFII